jgi:hypothetical protein
MLYGIGVEILTAWDIGLERNICDIIKLIHSSKSHHDNVTRIQQESNKTVLTVPIFWKIRRYGSLNLMK